ncbi:MAG: YbhB/YbcL family Raf kinase inhibitor-like protein, partial [Candidatus Aminicenantales bacterium]
AFEEAGMIPKQYTCDGEDISPPLSWTSVPEGTKSLALICDDPDAPMGTWVHWLVWNIGPSITSIGENSVPERAVQGMNSFGKQPYGGPCPPSGTHHYHFKLYALDTKLELDSSSEKRALELAMEGHILDQAELIGLYQR